MIRLRNTLDRPRIFWLTDGTSVSIEGYGTSEPIPEGKLTPAIRRQVKENKLFILRESTCSESAGKRRKGGVSRMGEYLRLRCLCRRKPSGASPIESVGTSTGGFVGIAHKEGGRRSNSGNKLD